MKRSKVVLDGALVEVDGVAQDPLSRGFAFGYGVFETIKFIERSPCFFAEHLERLNRAAAGLGLEGDWSEATLRRQARRLFEASEATSGVFKISIFAGVERPRMAVFIRSYGAEAEAAPARLAQSSVPRVSNAFTVRHKTMNYLESVREADLAKRAGFDDALFCNEHGHLTEASMANLFFVRDGVLRTPDLECGLLDGIVRAKVIELAAARGLRVEEGLFPPESLLEAEEAFLTSSGLGPRPVVEYVDATGRTASYVPRLLPELRAAFLELERASALGA